jgi:hypothetical protein
MSENVLIYIGNMDETTHGTILPLPDMKNVLEINATSLEV